MTCMFNECGGISWVIVIFGICNNILLISVSCALALAMRIQITMVFVYVVSLKHT